MSQEHFKKWTAEQFMMWVNGSRPEGTVRFKDDIKIDAVLMDPCAFGREDQINQYELPRMPLGNKDENGKWLIEKVVEQIKPSVVVIFADCCGPYAIETQEATQKMFPHIQWIFLHFCDNPEWRDFERSRHAAEKALRSMNLLA